MLTLHHAGLTSIPALAPMNGEIHPGELLAIVGPNGAGKSTLLSMLSGYRRCEQGTVQLDDHLLHKWEITALANRRALVAQQEPVGFDWRVEELVCLGSNPDKALIAELLDDLDLVPLAKRSVLAFGRRAPASDDRPRRLPVTLAALRRCQGWRPASAG